MLYRFLLVAIVIQSCISHAVCAQEMRSPISLRDAIENTLRLQPQLRSFPLKRESAAGDRETAGLRPPLMANAGAEDAIGTGSLSDLNSAELTISLSRVIELGNKRTARVAVADSRITILDTEQEIVELDLLAEVTYRFIDVVAAQERVDIQRQAREMAEETVMFLEPLVQAGRAPEFELGRARARLSNAGAIERQSQSYLEASRVMLSTMWLSQSPDFSQANADLFEVGEAGSLNALLISLFENPSIQMYASQSRLMEARLQVARAAESANVQWTAGIRHLKEIDDTGLIFNVSIPLGAKERASGGIRAAQANLAELEYSREAALNAMRGQLVSLHIQLTQLLDQIGVLQGEVLPELSEVIEQTRSFYEAGNYSYVELISAQREYLDAQHLLVTSAANAHRVRTEIERLSGQPLALQSED